MTKGTKTFLGLVGIGAGVVCSAIVVMMLLFIVNKKVQPKLDQLRQPVAVRRS